MTRAEARAVRAVLRQVGIALVLHGELLRIEREQRKAVEGMLAAVLHGALLHALHGGAPPPRPKRDAIWAALADYSVMQRALVGLSTPSRPPEEER